jgi:hypothetical protein
MEERTELTKVRRLAFVTPQNLQIFQIGFNELILYFDAHKNIGR